MGALPFQGRSEPYAFDYASQLLGLPIEEKGKRLGRVRDLVCARGGMFPELAGICVTSYRGDRFLPLARLRDPLGPMPDAIQGRELDLAPMPAPANHFLVSRVLLDKQIVDVQGARVKRVNDAQFITTPTRTFLVNVDVGLSGLLRRLGFERPVRGLAGVFGRGLTNELISWKQVQTLEERTGPGPIKLAIDQAQLSVLHPGDLADIIEELNQGERVALLHSVDAETGADALAEMEPELSADILEDMDPAAAADILEEIDASVAVDILSEVDEDRADLIKQHMDEEERTEIEGLEKFEAKTAGSLMSTDFLTLPLDATVADALALIRQQADEIDLIHYIYLVNRQQKLAGIAGLRKLILAGPETRLSLLATRRLLSLKADDAFEDVADMFYKYNLVAIPILDDEDRMVGVVRYEHSFDDLVPYYYREVTAR